MPAHWLLPIDPAAHLEHQPADWRTRSDATEVWAAIGRSQPIGRWCLRSGYRTMRAGDVIWAYLAKRQEVCARGVVAGVVREVDAVSDAGVTPDDGRSAASVERWFVEVDWDADVTDVLTRNPVPRRSFGQVPMSTCRANPTTVATLEAHLETSRA